MTRRFVLLLCYAGEGEPVGICSRCRATEKGFGEYKVRLIARHHRRAIECRCKKHTACPFIGGCQHEDCHEQTDDGRLLALACAEERLATGSVFLTRFVLDGWVIRGELWVDGPALDASPRPVPPLAP